MKKLPLLLISAFATTTLATISWAQPEAATLQKDWAAVLADTQINSIEPGPISGIWEVDAGSHVFYTTEKGDKLIFGDILELNKENGYTNLTEERRKAARVQVLKTLKKEDMITFAAKVAKHNIYVFTDPDCGYCRKFHGERQALMDGGITINYLAMPRTQPGTESYNKSVAIWCAKDRGAALTEAKEDKFKDAAKTCEAGEKVVAEDVKLARQFGAQGTPTIVLEDGQVIPGYVPAQRIIDYYAQESTSAAK